MTRILGIDPGDRRIGIALSDPTQMIASPLTVLVHTSRIEDALSILDLASEHQAVKIVVGIPFDSDGSVGPQARKAMRLKEEIETNGEIPVTVWDESFSSQNAALSSSKLDEIDAIAAAHILQEYLDDRQN